MGCERHTRDDAVLNQCTGVASVLVRFLTGCHIRWMTQIGVTPRHPMGRGVMWGATE